MPNDNLPLEPPPEPAVKPEIKPTLQINEYAGSQSEQNFTGRKVEKVENPLSPQIEKVSFPDEEKRKAIEDFIKKNTLPTITISHAGDFDLPVAVKEKVTAYQPPITEKKSETPPQEEAQPDEHYSMFGRIVYSSDDIKKPNLVNFISFLFFIITFAYSTLTLLLLAIMIALAISLSNAGAPGFMFLHYYPKIGVLPVFAALTSLIFMFVAYKIREGSRLSWMMGTISLATLPVTFSIAMPVLSYPLIRLVTIYAGSAEKPIDIPSLDLSTLTQFFSVLLIFDLVIILLLAAIKVFKNKEKPLSPNAKTSIAVMTLFFLVPSLSVTAYGYYNLTNNDFNYKYALSQSKFFIYIPKIISGDRVPSTNYMTNEELGNKFNAVKIVYDVPLPTLMKTGNHSQIVMKQVKTDEDFDFRKFIQQQKIDPSTEPEPILVPQAKYQNGYILVHGVEINLYTIMPDNVLINLYTRDANKEDLIKMAVNLE